MDTPCGLISQAIQNASPERYSHNFDGDGVFGEDSIEEENAEIGFGCFCMIKVSKPLTLESLDRAAATVLDGEGASVEVVLIQTNWSRSYRIRLSWR